MNDFVLIDFDMIVIKVLTQILRDRFEMFDFDFCIYYLSMMIIRDCRTRKLILNQQIYVKQMFQDHDMKNWKSIDIFMKTFCRLKKIFDAYTIDKSLRVNYQFAVKFLMYFMLRIRSNIIYSISMINKYAINLMNIHWRVVKRIFCYLQNTYQMKFVFQN